MHSKVAKVGKMYKDKWNCMNVNYKRNFDYHKGVNQNTSY